MARGKQVVMVGDPKQLPPTAFFDRAESAADDEDVEGDLESILDECMGANLPTMNLAWHYRSRWCLRRSIRRRRLVHDRRVFARPLPSRRTTGASSCKASRGVWN